MSEEAQPVDASEGDHTDADIDTILAAFGGDTRAAIRSLLVANEFLMAENDRLRANVSGGYIRQRAMDRT
jgi:hypothetical protein